MKAPTRANSGNRCFYFQKKIIHCIRPERKPGFFVRIKEDDPTLAGLTAVILIVFRGLKFEFDTDIGEKDSFRSGLR
jgi:hypothetical protein